MDTTLNNTDIKTRETKGNRFAMMCGKIAIEQRKTLLVTIGGFLGLCAVLGLWSGFFGGAPAQGTFVFYIVLAWIACSLVASKMFSEITRKEGRTSLLMTPATAADKFIPRLLIVLPGMLLLSALGYLVYGYSAILMIGVKFEFWPELYNPFLNWGYNDTQMLCMMLSSFLVSDSFFILGAVAWPKRSFLKTLCFIALLQIALSFLGWLLMQCHLDLEVYDPKAFLWSIIVIMTMVAAGVIYLAFAKFKRLTVA